MARDDDELWRAIVDNYGDRPELDPGDVGPGDLGPGDASRSGASSDDQTASDGGAAKGRSGWEAPDSDWTSDRFVPPPPPPLPTTTKDRYLAWAGVFGSPAVLLVCLVLGIGLPPLIAYVLVAAFVGGFVYLVLKMPREPRDPGDDGAVL